MLAVIGYGLGAITKPVFPLAATPLAVFGARFADRIGKGIRGAPRDALVADITPPAIRGAAFGLRQSLDTVGAFTGPLIAVALMLLLSGDICGVFAWAIVPAIIAVVLLIVGVEEPPSATTGRPVRAPIRWSDIRAFGRPFWVVVALGIVFTMARFSEAFLVLRASDAGLRAALIPLVLVVMNIVYAVVSAPAGSLSDRIDRRLVLLAGLIVLFCADLVLAWAPGIEGVLLGVALWGLHMGLTQGLLAALVVDAAPVQLRGTAFGLFNLAPGITLLVASSLAGILWSSRGASAAFLAGAGFAVVAAMFLAVMLARGKRNAPEVA